MLNIEPSQNKFFKTKQEYVYQVLKEAIMTCDIPPNEKLIISNIASQLEVSAIPVREALQNLQSERLVTYNHHVGAVAAPITEKDVIETFTIKEGLESAAVRIASESLTDSHRQYIKTCLQQMDEVIANEQYEQWGRLNADFHKALVNVTEMPVLIEMHMKILDKWTRIRRYFFNEVLEHRHERFQQEHHAIFAAVQTGNVSRAEQVIKQHNQQALQDYMAHLEAREATS